MRRLRVDLILCFKILKEFVDVDASEFFYVLLMTLTRGYGTKLVHSSVRINVRQHFFAAWVIPVWNSFSSNVVEDESISYFKTGLSKESLIKFVILFVCFLFHISIFCIYHCFYVFPRVTATASLDPEASLSVRTHTMLSLYFIYIVYIRVEKFLNK